MKRRGPRTEPNGMPCEEVCEEERVLPHLTRKERDERYDEKNNPVDDSAMELEAKPR